MNTWTGKLLGWLSLAAFLSFGVLAPQTACAAASPTITTQPASQSVEPGVNVGFSVAATGNSLVYQWTFKGTNLANNGHILSPYSPTMIVMNVSASDVGNYQVIITNSHGSVTSSIATLTLLLPPSITGQPTNQTAILNSNAMFTVEVSGTAPFGYQWQKDGLNLSNGGTISGATSATLNLANIQTNDAGSYQVVVTNNYGSVTSAVASLTVFVPPFIEIQPTNQMALVPNNVVISAVAGGTGPFEYQWYLNNTPLTDNFHFASTKTPTLYIWGVRTNDAGDYQLVVSNSFGCVTSSVATLTVHFPPKLTGPPVYNYVVLHSNANLSVSATGEGELFYQWYHNGPLVDGGRVSGSTTTNLTISNVQESDDGVYGIVVTDLYGSVGSSCFLKVGIPAYITSQPADQIVPKGTNASFTVAAGGTSVYFQWYSNGFAMVDSGRISGANSSTLNIANTQTNDNATYCVVVTNNYGTITSSNVALTVLAPVEITMHPTNRIVWPGTNVAFTVAAAGSALAYQWKFNGTPLADDGRISGCLTPTLMISNVQNSDAGSYSVLVTNLVSASNSQTATLTVYSIRYVDLNNATPLPPFTSWATAATNIQDAIVAAIPGEIVLVTNGVYATGGWAVNGGKLTNRVVVNKPLTVKSVNGPEVTVIQGYQIPSEIIGDSAVRCVYLTNGAVLSGFGLTGGATRNAYSQPEDHGGGILCQSSAAMVTNCIIYGNVGGQVGGAEKGTFLECVFSNNYCLGSRGGYAGAVENGTLINCKVVGNSAYLSGGVMGCRAINCLFYSNSGVQAGSFYGGSAVNCTIVDNYWGPADYSSRLTNCIIYNNANTSLGTASAYSYCCLNSLPASGEGNITNAPLFVNPAGGDYHLQPGSPCINAGNNTYVTNAIDLDGLPRIVGGTVDIGAYEYQTPASVLSYAWAQQYGLPTDGSADNADTDGDQVNNFAEWKSGTVPTNAVSVLKMSSATNGIPGMVVTWQSVSGITYYLQRSSDLAGGFSSIVSNLVGQVGSNSYPDTTATNAGPYFYRVGVQ